MKRTVLVVALLLVSLGLFAESEILIQGAYLNASRTFTTSSGEADVSLPSAGLNIISFGSRGEGIGFFTSASFLMPLEYKINGTDYIDYYDDMKITLDAIMGPGINISLGNPELLIGGGLHFNGFAIMSSNFLIDPTLSYTLGAGVSVTAKFPITENFNFNIGAMGGYDFIEILHRPEWGPGESTKSGITALGVNAGIGIKY